jgi:D-lactate dehydrogenase (cytochrome)
MHLCIRASPVSLARAFSAASVTVSDATLSKLDSLCNRVTTNTTILDRHGDDESHQPVVAPEAVAYAHSTEEVQAIVRVCSENNIPVIPFGTGTSLEGHIQALHGGISLDLSEMNQILEVNDADLDCRVQAGVTRLTLNTELRHTGLQFPVDPGADASLGGMVSCGASGTAAVRYGTMRENTLGLTCVLASGEVITTGTRARKSSAGYDLTRLLVGSEGTLGVITECQLKLCPIPAAVSAAVCSFPSLEGAAVTVATMLQYGLPIARSEILDAPTIAAFNAYARDVEDMEVTPTLFLEFDGVSEAIVSETAEVAKYIAHENGGGDFKFATNEEQRRKVVL